MQEQKKELPQLAIGIDIGGTNTDSIILDLKTQDIIKKHKSLTSKQNPSEGIKNCLTSLTKDFEYTKQISYLVVGTTHLINEVIQKSPGEEKLQRVAVIRLCGKKTYDFSCFSYIHNEELLKRIRGPSFYVDGGFQTSFPTFQLEESFPLSEEQIKKCADQIMEQNLHNIVISSPGSLQNPDHELKCRDILVQYFKEKNYHFSYTLSHKLCDREGLSYRENAGILNECLKYLAQQTFNSIQSVLDELNLTFPFMLSANNGSFLSRQESENYPVKCISASIINSLKGGVQLYNLDNKSVGLILDIGGTSTDMAVLYHGSARESGKHLNIGNVIFDAERMPMVSTIALGGGSIVKVWRDEQTKEPRVEVLNQSIAKLIKERNITCNNFEKDKDLVMCNSDFALQHNAFLEEQLGADKNKLIEFLKKGSYNLEGKEYVMDFNEEEIKKIIQLHKEQVTKKIVDLVNSIHENEEFQNKTEILLCGGGSLIVDRKFLSQELPQQMQVKELIDEKLIGFANAVGASRFEVTKFKQVFNAFARDDQKNEDGSFKWDEILGELEEEMKKELTDKKLGQEPFFVLDRQYGLSQYGVMGQINYQVKLKAKLNLEGLGLILDETKNYQGSEQLVQLQPNQNSVPLPEEKQNVYLIEKKELTDQEVRRKRREENRQKYGEPTLVLKSEEDIKALVWGAGLLGCGGGGSTEQTEFQLIRIFREYEQDPVEVYDVKYLEDGKKLSGVGFMGLPSLFPEYTFQLYNLERVFEKIVEVSGGEVSGIIDFELGGLNGITPLILSYTSGIPAFDCHMMDRAYPRLFNCITNAYKHDVFPIITGDMKDNLHVTNMTEEEYKSYHQYIDDVKAGKPYNPDEFVVQQKGVGQLCACNGLMYMAFGNLVREQAQEQLYNNIYKKAFDLGRSFQIDINQKNLSVQEAIGNLTAVVRQHDPDAREVKILASGRIFNKIYERKPSGQDIGVFNIVDRDDKTNIVQIKFQNEYIVALRNGEYIASCPDNLMLVDLHNGAVIGSDETKDGLEVILFAVPCVKKSIENGQIYFYHPRGFREDYDYKEY